MNEESPCCCSFAFPVYRKVGIMVAGAFVLLSSLALKAISEKEEELVLTLGVTILHLVLFGWTLISQSMRQICDWHPSTSAPLHQSICWCPADDKGTGCRTCSCCCCAGCCNEPCNMWHLNDQIITIAWICATLTLGLPGLILNIQRFPSFAMFGAYLPTVLCSIWIFYLIIPGVWCALQGTGLMCRSFWCVCSGAPNNRYEEENQNDEEKEEEQRNYGAMPNDNNNQNNQNNEHNARVIIQ